MSTNAARIVAVIGASGTGKSIFVKTDLLRRARSKGVLLVWSPLEASDHYAAFGRGRATSSCGELVSLVKGKQRACAVFVPRGNPKTQAAQFDFFCRLAWACQGATVLVEELSRVTSPSWAPPAWQNLSTAGRHRGLTLIGTAQRPAQIDKAFLGNCTEIRCYRVNYQADARAMAEVLRVDPRELLELPNLHYVHRSMSDRSNVVGVQKLPR